MGVVMHTSGTFTISKLGTYEILEGRTILTEQLLSETSGEQVTEMFVIETVDTVVLRHRIIIVCKGVKEGLTIMILAVSELPVQSGLVTFYLYLPGLITSRRTEGDSDSILVRNEVVRPVTKGY